jgi:exonuclease VII large subunit
MRFKPQEGLEVIAAGKLTSYASSSKFRIVIEALEPPASARAASSGSMLAMMHCPL